MRGANKANVQHLDQTPPEVVEISGARMVEVDLHDAKVGDVAQLNGSGMVRLPDGSVVTARGTYRFNHVGDHVFISADLTDQTTVNVVAAN